MLAKSIRSAESLRLCLAAAVLFAVALVASPAAWSQNAVNSATVTPPATVTDPNGANNSATDSDPITRSSNLSLVKIATPSPVAVGQLLTYTLTVSNAGPSAILAASTFSIVESLPAGLTGCSYTPSAGTFNVGTIASGATGTGTWTGVAIPSGGNATLTIACTVGAAAAASITNTATVVPPTGTADPDCSGAPVTCAGGNTGTVTTPVTRPQLTMTKTASAASFVVGVPASYTLQVSNTGTSATTASSTITDTIPTGLTIGTLPAGCTAAGQIVTCTIAAGVAAGSSTSFVIPVTATLAAGNPSVNTAMVSGGGDPTCPANARCTSSVTTPVNSASLNIAKTAGTATGPSVAGVYTVTYTVTVTNSGTLATTYGGLSDSPIFPSNITETGITWTTSGPGAPPSGSQAGPGAYQLAPVNTPIAAGATHTFNVAITYGYTTNTPPTVCLATPTPGSGLYNAVSLPAGQESGVVTDNATCVNSPPQPPQLTMTKTASAASFTVGVPASYTLQVTNNGGVATTAATTISDTIPTGLTIGTLPASCTAAGQTVTCTIAAGLAVGGSTSFVIPVTPTLAAGTSVTNSAMVSGGGDPTCPANARCTSSVTTPVNAPQLTIDKTAGTPSGNTAGSTIAYSFLVTNTGNVTLTGIVINDANLDAAAVCAVTTLAPGASTTCTGTHTITQAEVNAGVVNNTATATGTTPGGGTTTSPPDTTSTPIAAAPALTIDKTAGTPSGNTAGSTIAYSFLVTNTGNVTLTGIVVNDAQLDAAAVCPVTTLAPGASTTCTGTHTITQAEVNAGTVNNTATATGTTPGGGTTTSPPDTTSTPIAATPALTIDKW